MTSRPRTNGEPLVEGPAVQLFFDRARSVLGFDLPPARAGAGHASHYLARAADALARLAMAAGARAHDELQADMDNLIAAHDVVVAEGSTVGSASGARLTAAGNATWRRSGN